MKRYFRLIMFLGFFCLMSATSTVSAKNSDADLVQYLTLSQNISSYTLIVNSEDISHIPFSLNCRYPSTTDVSYDELDDVYFKICEDLYWSSSNPEVLAIVASFGHDMDGKLSYCQVVEEHKTSSPSLLALKEGIAVLTAQSPSYGVSFTINVKVCEAYLDCEDSVYYTNNKYKFELVGNTKAVKFKSSNKDIAAVSKSGVVTTKKTGTVKITCYGTDGKKYTKKIKVQKQGLMYSKLTTYYFTGMTEGYYSFYPLIAKGIDVASWSSSNTSVIQINHSNANSPSKIGLLEIHGVGTSTITCTAKNGKTFTCKVTVVGNKPWSGLKNGYKPTRDEVSTHGWYRDLNKMIDCGDVIYYIYDYCGQIEYEGYETVGWNEADQMATAILRERYPGCYIEQAPCGDFIQFTDGDKLARIRIGCIYVTENY